MAGAPVRPLGRDEQSMGREEADAHGEGRHKPLTQNGAPVQPARETSHETRHSGELVRSAQHDDDRSPGRDRSPDAAGEQHRQAMHIGSWLGLGEGHQRSDGPRRDQHLQRRQPPFHQNRAFYIRRRREQPDPAEQQRGQQLLSLIWAAVRLDDGDHENTEMEQYGDRPQGERGTIRRPSGNRHPHGRLGNWAPQCWSRGRSGLRECHNRSPLTPYRTLFTTTNSGYNVTYNSDGRYHASPKPVSNLTY